MSATSIMLGTVVLIVLGFVLLALGWALGRLGIGARAVAPASLEDAERRFVERMRDVSLVGSYTEQGRDQAPSTAERYDIASVEKVGPDRWRFNATLTCCGLNGAFPVIVPMAWLGDTPMIMMTDTTLPGLGTFSVRIFFFGDRYSGTWQHGDRGGFMAGRIEPRRAALPALAASAATAPERVA